MHEYIIIVDYGNIKAIYHYHLNQSQRDPCQTLKLPVPIQVSLADGKELEKIWEEPCPSIYKCTPQRCAIARAPSGRGS